MFLKLFCLSILLSCLFACSPSINVKATDPVVKPTRTIQSPLYDATAATILIYANVGSTGPPPSGQAQCATSRNPVLRVWGDGLVFLNRLGSQPNTPTLYSAQLDHARLDALIAMLVKNG